MAAGGIDDREMEAIVKSLEELGFPKEMYPVLAHKNLEKKEKERDMRNKQKMEDGSFRKCPPCGEKGKHRCGGCYLELYCSKECQKKDWKKGHKEVCKVVRAQFKEVKLAHYGLTGMTKKVGCDREVPKKNFVVKITVNSKTESMFVENEDDGLLSWLDRSPGQEELYDRVREEVMEKGVKMDYDGAFIYSGCYYALYKGLCGDGGHKLEINPDRMQPMAVGW